MGAGAIINDEGCSATTPDRWGVATYAAFLATAPIFRQLPPERLREVASLCQTTALRRGEILFHEGAPADTLYFLTEGRVKVLRGTTGGQEVILRVIGPGEVFGGSGGWGDTTYPASAVAIEAAIALRLAASDFAALVGTYPDLGLALIRELAGRLREAESRIIELQTEWAEQRLARALLRLACKDGAYTAAGIDTAIPLSRQDLAELIGTTIGTVSRTLSAWERRGLVATGRERVTISDAAGLAALAHDCLRHDGR